jgi:hypothetical protein
LELIYTPDALASSDEAEMDLSSGMIQGALIDFRVEQFERRLIAPLLVVPEHDRIRWGFCSAVAMILSPQSLKLLENFNILLS